MLAMRDMKVSYHQYQLYGNCNDYQLHEAGDLPPCLFVLFEQARDGYGSHVHIGNSYTKLKATSKLLCEKAYQNLAR